MEDFVTAVLLLGTLYLFRAKRVVDAVFVVAVQSAGLAAAAFFMWLKTGLVHLLIAAGLTLAVKTIAIPWILFYAVKKTRVERRIDRTLGSLMSVFVALVLVVVGQYVAANLDLPGVEHGMRYLSAAIILVFLGTFTIINNKQVLMQGIGVIVIENGLFLLTQSLSYGMPLVVELGIFFDLFVAVIIIVSLTFKIHSVFHSLNTEKMRDLRG